jgi:hypothetical protein
MHIRNITFFLFINLFFCFSANAALIDVDLHDVGDSLITRDTNTNLDWLDLSQTLNFSYENVLVELGAGGQFEGFRYATVSDVDSLQQSAGLPTGLFTFVPPAPVRARMEDLINRVGVTQEGGGLFSYGITATPFIPTTSIEDRIFRGFSLTAATSAFQGIINDNISSSTVGSWLVRDIPTPVPLPSAVFLFFSAFFTLIGWKKITFGQS